MAELSGDEVVVGVVCALIALVTTWGWMWSILLPQRFDRPSRWGPLLAPALGWCAILVALRTLASADVRDEPLYLGLYLVMGIAWIGLGLSCLPLCGFSARDDVGENANHAAAPVLVGAALGLAACFAGANIGDGPGWWCVVWAAGLATAAWFATLVVLARHGRLAETVTVERDPAAGARLGACLVAAGILCGRGAAGDWTSAAQTVYEFRATWPLLVLLALALAGERVLRPTPQRPASSWPLSLVLIALEVVTVAVALVLVGPMPDGYRFPGVPDDGVER